MSKEVWNPEKGWHDGPEVSVGLDERGRLAITPISLIPLENGRTVIMADVWTNRDGMGEGVVLAQDGRDTYQQWVTWHVFRHVGQTEWVAEHGDYHHDKDAAIAAYHERRQEVKRP